MVEILAKNYHDLHAKKRKGFREGENILVKTRKVWEPDKIVSKYNTTRSYIIINNKGNNVRRSHLKKTRIELKIDNYEGCIRNEQKEKTNAKYNKTIVP